MSDYFESKTDRELRQLAVDLHEGKVFTDRHLPADGELGELVSVFMPIAMGAFRPKPVAVVYEDPNERYEVLDEVLEDDKHCLTIQIDDDTERTVEIGGDGRSFKIEVDDFPVNEIGMIYEYLDKATPLAVNGKPSFFSMHLLNREDAEKVMSMYTELREEREKFMNPSDDESTAAEEESGQ